MVLCAPVSRATSAFFVAYICRFEQLIRPVLLAMVMHDGTRVRGLTSLYSVFILAFFACQVAQARTDPEQLALLQQFRDKMVARPGGNWSLALASWKCPTNPSNSKDGDCDPCGEQVWGNWEHIACRGARVDYDQYAVPGNGFLTNLHVTDYHVEGTVPLEEMCPFDQLTEFDLDGGQLTGTIPADFDRCFPRLMEIDLSYNQLTGEIPSEIANNPNLEQFKIEDNEISGPIPESFGSMQKINWLRFAKNKMSGKIPESLKNTAKTLYQLELANNDFEGDLHMLSGHDFVDVNVNNNPKLCGMVPIGVRFAHGFNYHQTRLGVPC